MKPPWGPHSKRSYFLGYYIRAPYFRKLLSGTVPPRVAPGAVRIRDLRRPRAWQRARAMSYVATTRNVQQALCIGA